jgi:hypothetical protein
MLRNGKSEGRSQDGSQTSHPLILFVICFGPDKIIMSATAFAGQLTQEFLRKHDVERPEIGETGEADT